MGIDMDKILLILAMLAGSDGKLCPVPILDVEPGLTWGSKDDIATMNRAKFVCATDFYYRKDTPCLVKFTKYGKLDYRALCGAMIKVDNGS